MAIYGIGAYYDKDVSEDFKQNNVVGTGHNVSDAPDIHEFIKSLKTGDIVYIKSVSSSSSDIIVKGIGIISDNKIVSNSLVKCGRNVIWKEKKEFRIPKPEGKNNVRSNTIYEEFHSDVLSEIIRHLI